MAPEERLETLVRGTEEVVTRDELRVLLDRAAPRAYVGLEPSGLMHVGTAFVIGSVGQLAGLNVIGMKRRKFSRDSIHAVRKAYRMLFFGEGTFASRIDLVEAELGADAAVAAILAFVREGGSRPLCHPGGGYRG